MTLPRSSLGILIICAVCFAVMGVSSASAQTLHECQKVGSGGTSTTFSDANCTTPSIGGEYRTVPLPLNTTVNVKGTNTTSMTMTASPLGIAIEITCSTLSSEGGTATNVEEGGKMKIKGEVTTTIFSGCEMKKPAGCVVPAEIKTKSLVSETVDTETTMRTKITPKEGTTFVSFPVSNCGILNGEKTVVGTASSETVTPTTQRFSATSGSALTFAGATVTLTGDGHGSTTDGTPLYAETP
jgi:hypothetical protein